MIKQDEVRHIAKLAKMYLTDKEVEIFTPQLSQIFDFFGQLKEVDTEGVAETAQVTGLENVVRTDDIRVTENTDEYLECSPHPLEDHCLRIPRIMSNE